MPSPLNPLPRRLSELLEEQQEPFLLDVYLLENGFSKRILKSKTTFMCWGMSSHGLKRRKGGILRCLLTKFGYWEFLKKALNWDSCRALENKSLNLFGCFSEMGSKSNAAGFRRLSSSDDGETEWKDIELSPVSVLEMHSNGSSSILNHSMEEENPSTSNFNSPIEATSLCFSPKEAKREKHPPRQLLLDLVKEIDEKSWNSYEYLGQERCGSSMEENIFSWERQRGDLALIAHWIDLDISVSSKDWNQFKAEKRKIGIEIEWVIFEEIREECVLDMLNFHCTMRRF